MARIPWDLSMFGWQPKSPNQNRKSLKPHRKGGLDLLAKKRTQELLLSQF